MNKKLAFLLSCCAAAGFMACNETVDWTYTEKCEDGAEQCHENTVRRCVDGEWDVVEKCEGDTPVCDSTSHTCIATPILGCTTGETKCEGNKLVKCENSMWTEGVECTGDTPVCGKNASNVDDCIAKPSLGCTTGETKCEGNKLVKCENAIWTEGVECTGDTPVCGKNESNVDACIAKPSLGCTTGETKCEGNKLFTCENAIWNEGVECTGDTPICGQDESNVAACIADTTVKCVNGDDEYEVGDGYCDESGVAQVCGDDGEFEAATDCAGRICEVNENHVAACRDGNKCVVNEETGETVEHNALYCDTNGNVAKCDDGTGRVETPCTAPEVCENASKTCKEPKSEDCMYEGSLIANGSTICKENGKVTCKDGNLSNVDKCTTDVENATAICTMVENVATCGYQCNEGYIEEDGKCIEKIECEEGKYLCDPTASTYSVCYWGGWQDQGSCENFQYSSTTSKHGTVFACNDANDGCIITACEDGYEPTGDGQGCQETTVVSHCVDFNGNVAEPDSWFCKDATTKAVCGLDGEVQFESPCNGEQICNPATVNSTFSCEDPATPSECTQSVCNGLQYKECKDGKFQAETTCTTDVEHATAICSETMGCSFTCDARYELNGDKCELIDGGCLSDADCKGNAEGKTTCDTKTGMCIMPTTPSECTQSVCNGLQYKECKDGKFQAETTCTTDVEHATAICSETTGCGFTCDARYTLVDGKCELIDGGCLSDADCKDNADGKTTCDTATNKCIAPTTPAECTENEIVCDGNVVKMCVDGKWGTVETCIDDKPICSVKAEGCIQCNADSDCGTRDDGKTTCDTATNKCIAPTTPAECTENDIMCDGNVVKMCVDGKWGEVETCTDDKPICSVKAEGCIQCNADSDCASRTDGKSTCNTETNTCVEPATPSTECTKDEDCASRTDGKTTCDTANGVCVKPDDTGDWVEIVKSAAKDSNTTCHGVKTQSGVGDYLNCGHFGQDKDGKATTFDPAAHYVLYTLDDAAIAKLVGKSQIVADVTLATQDKSSLKKAYCQFFNGDTALGTATTITLDGKNEVTGKCEAAFTSTENLQLRVWPDSSEATGSRALIRFYPVTISAK